MRIHSTCILSELFLPMLLKFFRFLNSPFLEWPTLQTRRRHFSRSSLFHKMVHHPTPAIQLPSYYLTTQYPTRQLHQYRFIVPATSTTAYQQSYFPKTIIEWNGLSSNMYETSSTEQFINMYLNTIS